MRVDLIQVARRQRILCNSVFLQNRIVYSRLVHAVSCMVIFVSCHLRMTCYQLDLMGKYKQVVADHARYQVNMTHMYY